MPPPSLALLPERVQLLSAAVPALFRPPPSLKGELPAELPDRVQSVSYTHLTLPTILLV